MVAALGMRQFLLSFRPVVSTVYYHQFFLPVQTDFGGDDEPVPATAPDNGLADDLLRAAEPINQLSAEHVAKDNHHNGRIVFYS